VLLSARVAAVGAWLNMIGARSEVVEAR